MTVAKCCVQVRDWKSSIHNREETEWGSMCWMVLGDVAIPKINIRGRRSMYRLWRREQICSTFNQKGTIKERQVAEVHITHKQAGGVPADEYEVLKNFWTESFQILKNNYNRRLLWTISTSRAALFSRRSTAGFLSLKERCMVKVIGPPRCSPSRSWTQGVRRSFTFVCELYQSQSVPREQWTLLCRWLLACLASPSSSSSSTVTTVSINLSRTFFIKCFNAKKKMTCM